MDMRSQDIPYDLLAEYLLETASPEAQARVAEWLAADPANTAVLSSLEALLRPLPMEPVTPAQTQSAWNRLSAAMAQETINNTLPGKKVTPISHPISRWQWAAMLALLLGAGWWLTQEHRSGAISGPSFTKLKDGSQVQLDSSASLEVTAADDEGKHGRNVHFLGKGAFNVVKRNTPFIVRLGKMEIHSVSSRFVVDYEPQVAGLRVHVRNGQVMVVDRDNNDSVMLSDGMLLAYNTLTDKYRVGEHVADMDHHKLVFKDIPLSSVLSTVETMYDIQVAVTDSSRMNTPVTATFTDETVDNVMESVSTMTNTQLQKVDGQSYRIK
ncbi:FecR family protein [Chitinophaga costaii]|uniref:FecR family protein n=1 Tax=Chitinophaga costaii TaxID=1335309 RepID=A0A1C4BHA9_9BACT|nr:FecR family protein [Chitinophaga costaii]PUZ27607.1 FecR family protein [Chitinophaga costaii]SCC06331.1 FecR family protein [Chitinophaga costaii]